MNTFRKLGSSALLSLYAATAGAQFVGGWGASSYQYAFEGSYGPAGASGCGLALTVADDVLLPGERTAVNVFGQFPLDGFALAGAEFDIAADFDGWSFANNGAIVGGQVLGATFSQAHAPMLGEFADPSNPIRIWTGIFQPASYEPRLVTLTAAPHAFSYYPNELTVSTEECEPAPGSAALFINPLWIGGVGFAPAAGTAMSALPTRDGVELAGADRLTLEAGMRMSHGVTVLAWARVDGVSPLSRTAPQNPDRLTLVATLAPSADRPMESLAINFTKVTFNNTALDPARRDARRKRNGYEFSVDGDAMRGAQCVLYRGEQVVGSFALENGGGPIADALPCFLRLESVEGWATSTPGPAIECRYDGVRTVALPDGAQAKIDRFVIHPAARREELAAHGAGRTFSSARIELIGVARAAVVLDPASHSGGVHPAFGDGSVRFVTSY